MIDTIKKTETMSSAEHPSLSWSRAGLTIACGSSWLSLTLRGNSEPCLRLRGKEQLAALDRELLAWRARSDNSPWRSGLLEHCHGDYMLCGNVNQLEFVFRGLRLEVNAPILCDLSNWLRLCQGKAPTWTDDEGRVEVRRIVGEPELRIAPAPGEAHGTILPSFKGRQGEELVTTLLRAAATSYDFEAKRMDHELFLNNGKQTLVPALAASWRLHYTKNAGQTNSVELSRTGLVNIARQVQAICELEKPKHQRLGR